MAAWNPSDRVAGPLLIYPDGLRWRLNIPPLRPASRASSFVHSWAVPFACAALPPLLAISRCFLGSIDANPRCRVDTAPSSRPDQPLFASDRESSRKGRFTSTPCLRQPLPPLTTVWRGSCHRARVSKPKFLFTCGIRDGSAARRDSGSVPGGPRRLQQPPGFHSVMLRQSTRSPAAGHGHFDGSPRRARGGSPGACGCAASLQEVGPATRHRGQTAAEAARSSPVRQSRPSPLR